MTAANMETETETIDIEADLVHARSQGLRANLGRLLRIAGHRPGDVFELQMLNAKARGTNWARSYAAHATTFPEAMKLATEAESYDSPAVYAILNRLDPACASRAEANEWNEVGKGQGTTDRDIIARMMVYLDFDVLRPKGTSATAAQVADVARVASKVYEFLAPILEGDDALAYGDSGNGRAIFIALDALAEKDAGPLIKALLFCVKSLFATDTVLVDLSVSEAKRLGPAFGTMKRKGAANVADRPHRRTALVCGAMVRRVQLAELRMLVMTLREDLKVPAQAEVDKILSAGVKPAGAAAPVTRLRLAKAPSPFDAANKVAIADVLVWLDLLDGEQARCPGCGEADGSSVVMIANGLKCSHNRCSEKGKSGFRTPVDVVMEVRSCTAKEAVALMAERFGFDDFAANQAKPKTKAPPATTAPPLSGVGATERAEIIKTLVTNAKGEVTGSLSNVMTILALDPEWRGIIALNAFTSAPVLRSQPPQRAEDAVAIEADAEWTEQDSTSTATWFTRTFGPDVSSRTVTEAMLAVARRNTFHPVRAYLDSLVWDEQPRVDAFFTTCCGTPASDYAVGVARCLFLSAVARVRRPGCKADTIPILEGPQGIGKSQLVTALFAPWSSDTPLPIGEKDAYQMLRSVWGYELAELASLKGRDATRIKSFASSPSDNYRPSYARSTQAVARQCVFIGSTNDAEYLDDATGARRFHPVQVPRINLPLVRELKDQLWAEADARFATGERWWPESGFEVLRTAETEDRYVGDPWEEPLLRWLSTRHNAADGLTMTEILASAICIPVEKQTRGEQMRVAAILRRAGWERTGLVTKNGERCRRWFAGEQPAPPSSAGCAGGCSP